MPENRKKFIEMIEGERERNFMLPGTEDDVLKGPNDWAMAIIFYLAQLRQNGTRRLTKSQFEDELIKASAIALAALEHSQLMVAQGFLTEDD
jgi:hypothetical protein